MENNDLIFEDISSHSSKPIKDIPKKAKKAVDNYGNSAFKNIDKAIKFIAFFVAVVLFLLFLAIAGVLFLLDKSFIFFSALIVLAGTVLALISLFLIYGLGHIISQNKEILNRLRF